MKRLILLPILALFLAHVASAQTGGSSNNLNIPTCKDSDIFTFELTNDGIADQPEQGYIAPVMKGGVAAKWRSLRSKLQYPAYARESGIQGDVWLRFEVTEDGTVENVCLLKGVHASLDEEAARVVRMLNFQEGAKLNGVPTRSFVKVRIRFALQ